MKCIVCEGSGNFSYPKRSLNGLIDLRKFEIVIETRESYYITCSNCRGKGFLYDYETFRERLIDECSMEVEVL
jgi:hypothetical protein